MSQGYYHGLQRNGKVNSGCEHLSAPFLLLSSVTARRLASLFLPSLCKHMIIPSLVRIVATYHASLLHHLYKTQPSFRPFTRWYSCFGYILFHIVLELFNEILICLCCIRKFTEYNLSVPCITTLSLSFLLVSLRSVVPSRRMYLVF